MSFSTPTPAAPVVSPAPMLPPSFGNPTQGQKPQRKASQPTFLGADANASPSQASPKTLLGQ